MRKVNLNSVRVCLEMKETRNILSIEMNYECSQGL